jgi:lipoprotein NlpI
MISNLRTSNWNYATATTFFGISLLSSTLVCAQTQQQLQCMNKNNLYSIEQRISACTAVVQSDRNQTNVEISYFYRGNAYSDKADYDRAIEDYTQAIRLNPKDTHALFNRGNTYRVKRDFDHSIADYDQMIRLDPRQFEAFNNRGVAHYLKGDYDRAIEDCNEAIRLNPQFANPYLVRGNAHLAKGDDDDAIADYDQAIQLDPKFASAYSRRGSAYAINGDFNRAIADYDQAIRLSPKSSEAYLLRGVADIYANALPKAMADLNQSYALDAKNAYAALWLSIVNKRSNLESRLADATAQIDMTKWPAPVIRLYLGQMTPEAVIAAADDPDPNTKKGNVCGANLYSGELALQQGSKTEAIRLLRLAVVDCPKSYIERAIANAELKGVNAEP